MEEVIKTIKQILNDPNIELEAKESIRQSVEAIENNTNELEELLRRIEKNLTYL